MFISTGMANENEIEEAVSTAKSVVVNHCYCFIVLAVIQRLLMKQIYIEY